MNTLSYRAGYLAIEVVENIGNWIPRSVLRWLLRRIPTEKEIVARYHAQDIDVDQFDLFADARMVLIRAEERRCQR